ncbi:hypothetical protein FACS189490_07520 [Clostridia bacterium]|nr:hypothetical protein FACS189490_07520 [Clostridia bacterium]
MNVKFNIIKRGYDPSEVDEHIDNLEGIIKSYKDKDAAIKNAIISAQLAADNIVQNAKNEAAQIKKDALVKVSGIAESVSSQRDLLNEFKREYAALTERYLRKVSDEDISKVGDKIDALEKFLRQFDEKSAEHEVRRVEPVKPVVRYAEPTDAPQPEHNGDSLTQPNPLNAPTAK